MQTANLIGQEWRAAESGLTVPVTDPATDEVIADVPKGGAADARLAIEAARLALDEWRARPAAERSMLLRRLSDLMLARQEQLALLMTREQGKPLAEARGEILYAASFIEWAAEEAKRVYGDTIPASHRDKRILVVRQPVGVTAAITPWNFPSAMITRKLGPALAAGCTMVVKPATQTPLSAIAIGELALEAGIPPGVVNIVTGDARAIGDELLSNPTVRKLSFTGSTEVGKVLMTKAAQNVTRLSLELGGHAPFLVFDDASLDAAVAGALATKFRNTGQTCICANRFFVQDGIYDAFVARLGEAARKIRVGRGTEDGVQLGPLIDDAALEKVEAHVDDARTKGAKVVTGGAPADAGPGLSRRFYQPTVIDGFTDAMLISHEETFGPVAPVRRFRDEAEAIELANRSIYGLAAYFYTQDASRLMRVAEALEYGVIGANDGLPSTAQAPFGGMKQSGIGREGGKYVMDEYLEVKYISWGLTKA
jgi:succinate-semialdehyde dehydrogenase/glutarate-semialdehyde dehydrogenase